MPAPQRRDYSQHWVKWDPDARKVKIFPKWANSSATLEFGLGNATIRINTSNIPVNKIVRPITGESTMAGLMPYSPYHLKRWVASPASMNTRTETLTGWNNESHDITFQEASEFVAKEVAPVDIRQDGYTVKRIEKNRRLEW